MDVSDKNSKVLLERSLYFLYMPLQYVYCQEARVTVLQSTYNYPCPVASCVLALGGVLTCLLLSFNRSPP